MHDDNDILQHYGMPRRSGRYPWGSGDNPYQRNVSFLSYVNEQLRNNVSERELAKKLGMTTTELRQRKSVASNQKRAVEAAQALTLKNKGMSNIKIGERMGISESSVRSLLDPVIAERQKILMGTVDMLKDEVAKKEFVDVGLGSEMHLGISKVRLNNALYVLENEGYTTHWFRVPQVGVPGNYTYQKALAAPGVPYSFDNRFKVQPIETKTQDLGRSWLGLKPVESIKSDEIMIRYAEDGGGQKDGVIELRRGIDNLSLGDKKYAQVRIGVDDTHYMKGMAIYSDDLPDGVNVIYNTNKRMDVPKMEVFKPMKTDQAGNIDRDNPFGATMKREEDLAGNATFAQRGALNILQEEGDWGDWSKTVSSQVLSKQPPALAKTQLTLNQDILKSELDEIRSYTNPEIKKHLLMKFADGADSSAEGLEAAGFPRQRWHVILPVDKLKETEIYAPNYKQGESVVLIRYPHGGKFEIPELTVNNGSRAAKSVMDQAKDAVGINSKVAQRLSGADFDGDTVLVIPNPGGLIKSKSPLKQLENWDHLELYKGYQGMIRPGEKGSGYQRGAQMGNISNLITDMTIKGASDSEIARAVRHSMVIIDADKHNLDYKRSALDNRIPELKAKYQGGAARGASTIISRAGSPERVPARKREERIDPKTGQRVYIPTGEEPYRTKTGKLVVPTTKSTKMREAQTPEQVRKLSSGTTIESVYVNHAIKLKDMANQARKEAVATKSPPYSPSARVVYQREVDSLNRKLEIAKANKPLERQAQNLAGSIIKKKREANPDMTEADIKKISSQALAEARVRTGAKKNEIVIEPREWEAIQARALSSTAITQILGHTDLNKVKQYALPRTDKGISSAKLKRAEAMLAKGHSQSDVAELLGISTFALLDALK